MLGVLKDIFRRKVRSALTIAGVAAGVFAIVALGATVEKSFVYVESLLSYYGDSIILTDARFASSMGTESSFGGIDEAKMEAVRKVPGVRGAMGAVSLILDPDIPPIGVPPMILGGMIPPQEVRGDFWDVVEGRQFSEDETGVAVVGIDLAKQKRSKVGGTIAVRGRDFEVVGIMNRTYINVNDSAVFIPLAQAREMALEELPAPFRAVADPEDVSLMGGVWVDEGADPVEVARRIEREVPGVAALDPDELLALIDGVVAVAGAAAASFGVLALLIGGFTIVNTMGVSVAERMREIGMRRALGASRGRIASLVLAESTLLGTLGGIIGVATGATAVWALNASITAQTGMPVFLVTPRLCAIALLLAVALGALSGVFPALRAARMDPVDALTYE